MPTVRSGVAVSEPLYCTSDRKCVLFQALHTHTVIMAN